ncbi:MAG TPA: DUF3501 family protein [Terriglobales bacterium]|nr:DUF3501 family protein [Terriglobales bacterium]
MKKITIEEIIGIERYEQLRDEMRRRIIALKKHRRLAVGDRVTLVFENHDTMLFQTQEMVRAEHIVDLDRIRDEIAVYNELIPDNNELSATLLIEITQSDRIREELVKLIGIDESVTLEIDGGLVVAAQFEPGRSKEDKLSAVQYVKFPFDTAAREAFLDRKRAARVVIEHPSYRHTAVIAGSLRESLVADLADS